ncbi:hypothetical protein ACH5RR_013815 [Cinchona calisaya]|uniref:Strictosidine synthase conserved region domain-containing protein n=1 Tax=Cinchona calisaya TaxID=153742 RepID=A0ABD3A2I8_9GENT
MLRYNLLSIPLVLLIALLVSVSQLATASPQPNNNYWRRHSQVFPIPGAVGPESLAFDRYGGGPYTGVSDGRIIKWQASQNSWIDFATTTPYRYGCEGPQDHVGTEARCGRPLGLSFNHRTGDLYIADAYMGLLVIGPNGGLASPLAREAEGIPFRFTNGLAVDQNTGMVYFTDTSTRFQRRDYQYVELTRDNTGRLLRFDPTTNRVTVLMRNLLFPNGVALNKNGDFLLVTETTNARVLKFWLEPSKFGKVEVFAQLPGIPDNINRNNKGEFWVAVNSRNGQEHRFGLAIKLSEDGKVLETVEDVQGETWMYGSDANEQNGYLWIGSVMEPCVVKLKI